MKTTSQEESVSGSYGDQGIHIIPMSNTSIDDFYRK